MPKRLLSFALKYGWRQQVVLLVTLGVSLPIYYASLYIPKTIINRAIGAGSFRFPYPLTVAGIEIARLDRIPLLAVLSCLFLAAVLANGLIKLFINAYKGALTERMLVHLRHQLFDRMLRLPLKRFRSVSQAEFIAMIATEVEAVGGFFGDILAQPAQQAGFLLTALLFIYKQDPLLMLAGVVLFPVQIWLFPKLVRRVNRLEQERVHLIRQLSLRVGEADAMIREIRVNRVSDREKARFDKQLESIFRNRVRFYRTKYFTNFFLNFMAQLTPFLFYFIGGYFVIDGKISLGSLVAIIAAYGDLSSPWQDLLSYYQDSRSAHVKYEQIRRQFETLDAQIEMPGLEADRLENPPGDFELDKVTVLDGGNRQLDNFTLRFRHDEHIGVVGDAGSGAENVAMILARLVEPSEGRVTIGGRAMNDLPLAITAKHMACIGTDPVMISGTIGDNLYYSLLPSAREDGEGNAQTKTALWAAQAVRLSDTLCELGLARRFDPGVRQMLAGKMVPARRRLQDRLQAGGFDDLVEHFVPRRFLARASLADNLIFGRTAKPLPIPAQWREYPSILSALRMNGLEDRLVAFGLQAASTLYRPNVPPAELSSPRHKATLMPPEQETRLAEVMRNGAPSLRPHATRSMLLGLALAMVPERDSWLPVPRELQEQVVVARPHIRQAWSEVVGETIHGFEPERCNLALTVEENLLFGLLPPGGTTMHETLRPILREVVEESGLYELVEELGLDADVGVAGSRLKAGDRIRLGIARGLMKRPDLMIINQTDTGLDPLSRIGLIEGVREAMRGRALLWVLEDQALAVHFPRVVALAHGRLVADSNSEHR
jgi:putative ABC transport system ATP-binding protein